MRHEGLWISRVRKCILEIRLGSYIQDNLSLHFFPDISMKFCLCFIKKKYFNSLNPQLSKLHNFDFIVSDKPEKVNLTTSGISHKAWSSRPRKRYKPSRERGSNNCCHKDAERYYIHCPNNVVVWILLNSYRKFVPCLR